jgi:hypothetical protein
MSKELVCNWPKSYLHITEELMKDQSKAARARERQLIKQMLQAQLAKNMTKTMTFTEDGLMLAIKMIDEIDTNG